MKVAFVHDHLIQSGGAERVLSALQAMWPDAPTFTLAYDKPAMDAEFGHRDIRTSFLQRLPGGLRKLRWYLPLMPTATERYDLSAYDVVISSCSAFAKGVVTSAHTVHICYCHTPTRYLWSDTLSYVDELRAPWLAKMVLPFVLTYLRLWDRAAADRVDHFLANSEAVRQRITKYYRRESTVIHPPVDVHRFAISDAPKTYYLIGGRIVAYKRFDIVIDAFTKLGIPLKVFGSGPAEKDLRRRAGPNIEFVGRVSDDERARLFAGAIAFLHPHEEDFGITAVESMAAGRPVIAYRRGGALETVIDGVTGTLFDEQSWEELADTVLHFDEHTFNPHAIRAHAETFATERFRTQFHDFVMRAWNEHRQKTLGVL
ncbi:glycosyltransferase [Candidatus Uhrbacteria bacterium]|nr:glycosyltransferase [Candidatus Uhrbacteria bacterium]